MRCFDLRPLTDAYSTRLLEFGSWTIGEPFYFGLTQLQLYQAWKRMQCSVVLQNDQIIGVLREVFYRESQTPHELVNLVLAPTYRGVGIGSAILEGIVQRAPAVGVCAIDVIVLEGDDISRRFLVKRGFKDCLQILRMVAVPDAPHWAQGFSLVTQDYRIGMDAKLADMYSRCFASVSSFGGITADEMVLFEATGLLSPQLTFFALDESRRDLGFGRGLIQTCSTVGAIEAVGVLPEHRGNGVGALVLFETVRRLRCASGNLQKLVLEVDANNHAARSLYERSGFALRARKFRMRRMLAI